MTGEQPELPLVAHPLSTSGSFSETTLHLLSICLPVPVHMAEIQATSSVCRLGSRDHQSPLYWYGALLIICLWIQLQKAMPVAVVDHSFCLSSPHMSSLKEHFL